MNKYDDYTLWEDVLWDRSIFDEPGPDSIYILFTNSYPPPFCMEIQTPAWFNDVNKAAAYVKYSVRDAILSETEEYGRSEDIHCVDLDELYSTATGETKSVIDRHRKYWDGINAVMASEDVLSELKKYLVRFNRYFAKTDVAYELRLYEGIRAFRRGYLTLNSGWLDEDTAEGFKEAADLENPDGDAMLEYFDGLAC